MISVIITSFKEPEIIGRAIKAVLQNKTKRKYEVIVAAPDEPTAQVIKKYVKKDKRVSYFRDKGKGKVGALNELFVKVKSEILILTDGDVWMDENAIEELAKALEDKQVGCVTGRPVAANDKNTMLGYWSHLLVDAGAHKIREKLNKQNKFIECSGYLFAFRNKIRKIPVDVAEDSIIPYLLWKQGYKIKYVPEAKVYVKYPNNLKDFIKQKVRTTKSHERLKLYAPDFPTVKSFTNELTKGPLEAIKYPKKIKEVIWTLCLFPVRLYIWYKAEKQRKSGKTYQDNWERIESTK
ncbi:glycosyltransferase family 2 protein [Candidatus Woesearchaeota archaeon]|nr:glycosyltransferase family 2 protein [Candidatus Woesearchaeota archaeon]